MLILDISVFENGGSNVLKMYGGNKNMIIFMINALQLSVPTSEKLVQCAFYPFMENTFDLDYSRGCQSDLHYGENSAVLHLYFNKNYATDL